MESQVAKMYENAGVKKQYYYFDSADGNTYTWELNENGNDKHNMCFIGKPKIKDREFTAEKQLELIKWLIKYDELHADFNDNEYGFSTLNYSGKYKKDFKESLASLINNELWQDLTEEEKQEIRRILT